MEEINQEDSEVFKTLENFVNTDDLIGLREYLIAHPENVDERDPAGVTILMCCAANGKLDFCHVLLNYGANINAVDRNLFSALTLAAKFGKHLLIRPLIERGADINHRDRGGMTPLAWCSYGGHIEVAKILLSFNAYNP